MTALQAPDASALPGAAAPPQPGTVAASPATPRGDDAAVRGAAPVRWLSALVGWALAVTMLGVLAFTVSQVLDRHWVKSSFGAHDQYARIALVWMTFLGIAVGIRDRINVRIELVGHLAPAWLRGAIALVLEAVTLVLAVAILVAGWPLIEVGGFQAIIGTPLNYDIMYAGLLAGMGLLVLLLALRFADRLTRGRHQLDAPAVRDDDAPAD